MRSNDGYGARWVWLMVSLLSLLSLPYLCQAAHSRRRMVLMREKESYDRVITSFSPDGRLSQVEYGMEASRRGSSIAAAVADDSGGICLIIHNSSFGKMHRIDHHIWLATAGLSGDARFLARYLREMCQQHRLQYGEAPTTKQVAKMAGQFQHYLTRSGGIRPLGCTALVVGIDPSAEDDKLGTPQLYQTDPGGIVEACTYSTAGKGRESTAKDIGTVLQKSPSIIKDLSAMASEMAQTVLSKLDDPKSVDVWTIEPKSGNRGGMQATCYQNIDKGSIGNLRDSLSRQQ